MKKAAPKPRAARKRSLLRMGPILGIPVPDAMPKPLTQIVACAENRVIGRDGRLPFDIPEDKKWFHDQTAGQTVVLGRICFQTWPKVQADGRQPVVITSDPGLASDRVRVAATVPAA